MRVLVVNAGSSALKLRIVPGAERYLEAVRVTDDALPGR